jgi:hypothetical protein
MGKWHAHTINRIGAKLTAVIDNDPAAGSKLASRYGARYFQHSDEYFGAGTEDVVHICSPPDSHFPLAMRALAAGRNVLVEKPLTEAESETIELVQQAAEAGRLLCPVYQFAFQRGLIAVQAALRKRSAEPLLSEFDSASAGGEHYCEDRLNSLILDILPHPMSVLHKLWPLTEPEPFSWHASWPRSGDLLAHGSHRGIPVLIRISLHARPTRCKMTLHHGQGTISQDFFHGHAVFDAPGVSRCSKLAGPFLHSAKVISAAASNLVVRAAKRQWAYPGLEPLVRQCYASIEKGNTSAPVAGTAVLAIARSCDEFRQ